MRKLLTGTAFGATMLAAALFAAPAVAHAAVEDVPMTDVEADEAARIGDTNRYYFDDDDVDGEVLSADHDLIWSRRVGKHASLITFRTDFVDYMIRQAWEV